MPLNDLVSNIELTELIEIKRKVECEMSDTLMLKGKSIYLDYVVFGNCY